MQEEPIRFQRTPARFYPPQLQILLRSLFLSVFSHFLFSCLSFKQKTGVLTDLSYRTSNRKIYILVQTVDQKNNSTPLRLHLNVYFMMQELIIYIICAELDPTFEANPLKLSFSCFD